MKTYKLAICDGLDDYFNEANMGKITCKVAKKLYVRYHALEDDNTWKTPSHGSTVLVHFLQNGQFSRHMTIRTS